MSAHERTVATLRALLKAIDYSARLDRNSASDDHGLISYEVRAFGHHVGFVRISRDGQLQEWI